MNKIGNPVAMLLVAAFLAFALYKGKADTATRMLWEDLTGQTFKPGLGSWLIAVVCILFIREMKIARPFANEIMIAGFGGLLFYAIERDPNAATNIVGVFNRLIGQKVK